MNATSQATLPVIEAVLRRLTKDGQGRYLFDSASAHEVAGVIEEHLAEDLRKGRSSGLFDLVRLARALEHSFKSPEAAQVLLQVLRGSVAGHAISLGLEEEEVAFRDACEKYTGAERVLPPAFGAASPKEAIRAALLMTPGELEARRVRPALKVERRSAPSGSDSEKPDTNTSASTDDRRHQRRRVMLGR